MAAGKNPAARAFLKEDEEEAHMPTWKELYAAALRVQRSRSILGRLMR